MALLWLLLLLLHAASARKITEEENEELKAMCGLAELSDGFSSTRMRRRVPVEVSEYSFVVALKHRTVLNGWDGETRYEYKPKPSCTGVLISPRHILTAAHCMCYNSSDYVQGKPPKVAPKELFGVIFEGTKTYSKISSIRVHPSYNSTASCPLYFDIAVIELEKDVNVRPVCMPEVDSVILEPDSIESIGYGNLEMQLVRYQAVHFYNRHKIIAVYSNTSSIVTGDSGGPLVQTLKGRHHLFGILSCDIRRTIAGPARMQKKKKVGGNFTDVRKYLDWICEKTGVCPVSGANSHQW